MVFILKLACVTISYNYYVTSHQLLNQITFMFLFFRNSVVFSLASFCLGLFLLDCQDGHKHCEYWASIGECKKNPDYMLKTCGKSCNSCEGMYLASGLRKRRKLKWTAKTLTWLRFIQLLKVL